jgi:hypothetical protein
MKLTKQWLKNKNACTTSYQWYLQQKTTDINILLKLALKEEKYDDIIWVLTKKLTKMQNIKLAIFSAKKVIGYYNEKYPNDKRPQEAIKSAEKYMKTPTKKNKDAANDAANAAANADNAAYAANAAANAANAAAYAAYAAANAAANAAAYAANAAAYAAYAAANAAANDAAYAARKTMKKKIINYGLKLVNI